MKLWKWFIKCPILFLLLLSWFGLTAFTWSEGRLPEKLDVNLIEHPVFTALLEPKEPDAVLNDLNEDLDNNSDDLNATDKPHETEEQALPDFMQRAAASTVTLGRAS